MKAIKSAMIMATILLLNVQSFASDSLARSYFYDAKVKLEDMLNGQAPLSYEDAIYYIENAWWEDRIDYKTYKKVLDHHTANIKRIIEANRDQSRMNLKRDLLQTKEQKIALYEKALSNQAIFEYITDTAFTLHKDGLNYIITHPAFKYKYADPLGTIDWTTTHVTGLLNSYQGNCFALSSLFKIFSDRLQSGANLTTAPEHIYIRHNDDKGTGYNIELSNGLFPGSGTISTVTYTPNEAIRSGIALRELDQRQSVILCLVYLAKGYEYKLDIKEDDFMLSCAEFALKYDSLNLNAMLLKAEVMETKLLQQEKEVAELSTQEDFQKYQDWVTHIYNLGYREMPFEMKNLIIKGWSKDSLALLATTNHTPNRLNHPTLKDTRYASLSWGLFDEEIRTKPLERYGNTVFDTKKKTIVSFLPDDILYHHYNFDPVVFAWSVDPMAHKMPGWSPYSINFNNPIIYIDPDGQYPIHIITRSYAPFKAFGPSFARYHGDDRGHSLDKDASYRTSATITYDTETMKSSAVGGKTYSRKIGAKTGTYSKTYVRNRSKVNNLDVHSYGNNADQRGSWDIDQFTKVKVTTQGDIKKDHILNVKGTISGDDFPNQESIIYDSKGNALWLGNFATEMNKETGPLFDLARKNEGDVNMNIDINIRVNGEGEFQGVMQNGETISRDDWNKQYQSNGSE